MLVKGATGLLGTNSSLCREDIIDCVKYEYFCSPWKWFSQTSDVSLQRNDMKSKYALCFFEIFITTTIEIMIQCCNERTPIPWWRHQMKTFSAFLVICAGNSPVPGEFPTQRPVTRSFDVFFDLRLNKRLSKQPWVWWFETLSCPLWRHRNVPS